MSFLILLNLKKGGQPRRRISGTAHYLSLREALLARLVEVQLWELCLALAAGLGAGLETALGGTLVEVDGDGLAVRGEQDLTEQ